ncbi:hypothetical protein H6F43_03870 [Leptolyngbya sp. FACHB-36]|uniref:hypothetical protein n=1 Tax=Leptolyngbya sp. FACHB-36 TaxID=2692808 RepID=UPI00168111E8|nr:hypothetical protein [Leptolyngbya sp. FACHB-36]MBD2019320.1 hypothetical protein [Leptolyngbya sp. FACHB-36]
MSQKDLFRMLAESRLRQKDCSAIRSRSLEKIPQTQDALLREIEQLRDRIRAAGVGQDSLAEKRYIKLLEAKRILDQSHAS